MDNGLYSFTRSFTPMWNESLIYNEIYSYVLEREQDDPPTILFFEVYSLIFSWSFFQFLILSKMYKFLKSFVFRNFVSGKNLAKQILDQFQFILLLFG